MPTQNLSENDKTFIRDYVADARDEKEKIARRKEVADSFGLPLQKVAAITAWTKIRAKKSIQIEVGPDEEKTDNFDSITPAPPSDGDEPSVKAQPAESSELEGGEHIDYDNEVKRAWRKKLQEFINEHTDLEKRKHLRVLCLPGKRCLEIPLYLELGFNPKNIVGVEGGDQQARTEFQQNAEKLGIDFRLGKLEKIVKEEKQPFDVISLDFLGPICVGYANILADLYLSEKALLMVNFMAKRENKIAQLNLKAGQMLLSTRAEPNRVTCRDGRGYDLDGLDLKDARDHGYLVFLSSVIGDRRPENKLFEAPTVPPVFISEHNTDNRFLHHNAVLWQIKKMMDQIISEYFQHFLALSGYSRYPVQSTVCPKISALMFRALMGRALVRDNKRYEYLSKAGAVPTAFNSEFIELETPRKLYRECSETVDFFRKIIQFYFQYFSGQTGEDVLSPDKAGFRFYHKNGARNVRFESMKDTLIFVDVSGQTISRVSMKKLEEDLKAYDRLKEGNIIDLSSKKPLEIDRQTIV